MRLTWAACIWVCMHLHAASESCEGDSTELLQGRVEGSLCHILVFLCAINIEHAPLVLPLTLFMKRLKFPLLPLKTIQTVSNLHYV